MVRADQNCLETKNIYIVFSKIIRTFEMIRRLFKFNNIFLNKIISRRNIFRKGEQSVHGEQSWAEIAVTSF